MRICHIDLANSGRSLVAREAPQVERAARAMALRHVALTSLFFMTAAAHLKKKGVLK